MAKLNRESKLRDKRAEKEMRKAARKSSSSGDAAHADLPNAGSVGHGPGAPQGGELISVTGASPEDDQ